MEEGVIVALLKRYQLRKLSVRLNIANCESIQCVLIDSTGSPFFQASHSTLNTASLVQTDGTETLFSCTLLQKHEFDT
jgi:hypothetical protein